MQAPAVAVSLAGRRSAAPSLSDLAYSKSGPQRKYVVRNGLLREPVLQDGTVGAVMHKSGGRITSTHSPPRPQDAIQSGRSTPST